MPNSALILVYGSDLRLMETRRWVLEKADFEVLTALNFTDVCQILSAENVDLFILCHTLSAKDRDTVLSFAHSARPEMKVLVMDGITSGFRAGINGTVLSAFANPRFLISTVRKMTGPKGSLPTNLNLPRGVITDTATQTS